MNWCDLKRLDVNWCELWDVVNDGTEEWPKWTIPFGWALNSSGEIKTKAPEFYWWRDICAGNSEMGNCWFAVDSLLIISDHSRSFMISHDHSYWLFTSRVSKLSTRSRNFVEVWSKYLCLDPQCRPAASLWSAFCFWQKTLEISQPGLARRRFKGVFTANSVTINWRVSYCKPCEILKAKTWKHWSETQELCMYGT